MIEIGDPLPDLGTLVLDSAGALADGGAVTLLITRPDQTTSSPAVVHAGLGTYTAVYVADQIGLVTATWTVTGANAGVNTVTYNVEQGTGIVGLAEVKKRLGIKRIDQDDLIQSYILTASNICEGPEGCNRIFRRVVVTGEEHTAGESGDFGIQLFKAPVISLTTITIDGVSQTVADYDLTKSSGWVYAPAGWPIGIRRNNVVFGYVAGVTGAIPDGARDGTIELVRHLMAPMRGGSGIPRQEEPDYTPGSGYLVPNRVASLFRSAAGY